MKRKIIAPLFCVFGIFALNVLTGCRLAQAEADGAVPAEDRLVGIFLTTEYLDLFDAEGYLNDRLNRFPGGGIAGGLAGGFGAGGDMEIYRGRLYAELTARTLTDEDTGEKSETEDYVFPFPGIPFLAAFVPSAENREAYLLTAADPAVSDGHTDYRVDDAEDSISLTGTVYVSPANVPRTYYFNPVYQSADGGVYAVQGSGFRLESETYAAYGEEGSMFSQTLDAETTRTENGETKTLRSSVALSVSKMSAPEKIFVLQMDEESSVLARAEYTPGAMPARISPRPETAYLIVEAYKHSGAGETRVSRVLYGAGSESIESFFAREDGVCVKEWTPVIWPE